MAEEPFAASAEQLGEEEQLVRRYLEEARKADRCWTGYLDSEDALKEFERDLARTNSSGPTAPTLNCSVILAGRLLFSAKQKGCILPIELECPFRVLSKRTKGCVFGRERHNVHCEKPVIELPPACSAYKRKVASKATLARLERALSSGDGSVTRQVQVYVSFSSMNGHAAHTFGMALAYWQPMNPEVSAKINMLVQQGTSSVSQVQKCVQFYVEHVLFAGKPNPPPSCRAFLSN
ncbi:hypothetical protein HPB51_016176 [Rhipicephalus microplus]|uniref:Uncharacterized protein n=1 Tax=Rhipicephalus microplus TaxID=6941 RepID=A0A9J6E2I0_RHIMP|nr:hypothetical protein HPB51_016176 [Rhipicephalus microplus]